MACVYVGIGTNLGNRRAMLAMARGHMAAMPKTKLIGWSKVYETVPVGPVPQGQFLNAAAQLDTQLSPEILLDQLASIEQQSGRSAEDQRVKWGPRILDIDILLYDDLVISTDKLVIPHPLMHERWFVLQPMADLAPQVVHPVLEITIEQLLKSVEPSTTKK